MKLRIVLCCALLTCGALAQTLNTAITGGGTTNYIAKWSSSTNLTTSALCQSASGGLVGVGTCFPTQRLQVNSGNMLVKGVNNFTAAGQSARYYVGDTNHALRAVYGSGLALDTYKTTNALTISDNGGSVAIAGSVFAGGDATISGHLQVSNSSGVENQVLGNTFLVGDVSVNGSILSGEGIRIGGVGQGLTFPDGTVQTTAYTGGAALKQAAAIVQLQRDRDNVVELVRQLQARIARLEKRQPTLHGLSQ